MNWKIYTDGGCRDNPGRGAWGFVVETPNQPDQTFGDVLPQTTNNAAEYRALLEACEWAAKQPDLPVRIDVYSDSKLMVEQINYRWQVNEVLAEVFRQTRDAFSRLEAFCEVTLTHVKRELNKKADLVCNEVMDAHGIVCSKKGRPRAKAANYFEAMLDRCGE